MRIRSIKPEFWKSEDIAALPWPTRLLFIGLWSYADDNGVGRDNEKLIKADLFALEDDPRETLATVSRGLQNLSEGNQITRYTVNWKPFLFINAWADHQRIDKPNKERYPLPTCGNAIIRDTLATPSRDTPETLATGAGEQGSSGTEEQGKSAIDIADAPQPSKQVDLYRLDVTSICEHLANRIEENGALRPDEFSKSWMVAARLMLDKDKRDEAEIHQAIDWCQSDEFWRGNILSMPKLREKYDQLKLQAARKPAGRRNDLDWDAAMARARATDEQNGVGA